MKAAVFYGPKQPLVIEEVAGQDRSKTISFPRNCVFVFDDMLFAQLNKAYQEGADGTLATLWAKAKPIE